MSVDCLLVPAVSPAVMNLFTVWNACGIRPVFVDAAVIALVDALDTPMEDLEAFVVSAEYFHAMREPIRRDRARVH